MSARVSFKITNCRVDLKLTKNNAKNLHDALEIENENRRKNDVKEVTKTEFINELVDIGLSAYFVFERL